jgi:hypothetical protein
MSTEDYEQTLLSAQKALKQAQTAEDVRKVWRDNFGTLGHRTLGRLLIGQSVDRLLERRELRAERER